MWRVNFDPSVGGAIQKLRPAVIVSHDAANRNLNRVQAVPITSGVQKLYSREAYVTLNGEPRKAVADQIMTASKERLGDRIGRLSTADIKKVEQAIRVQLDLTG